MIRVPLTVIVFLYLFVFLAVVFAVWLLDERRRRRRVRRALQFRLRCAICGFEFEDRSHRFAAELPALRPAQRARDPGPPLANLQPRYIFFLSYGHVDRS